MDPGDFNDTNLDLLTKNLTKLQVSETDQSGKDLYSLTIDHINDIKTLADLEEVKIAACRLETHAPEKFEEATLGEFVAKMKHLDELGFFKPKGDEFVKNWLNSFQYLRPLFIKAKEGESWTSEHGLQWDSSCDLGSYELNTDIFKLVRTDGVQDDIPIASLDQKRVHLFSVASQYNLAEATRPFTPAIGEAMSASEKDFTQGPLARRVNPKEFEAMLGATHFGANILRDVGIGTTYDEDSPVKHGYLMPSDNDVERLAGQMKANYKEIELLSYGCIPEKHKNNKDAVPVYSVLAAAPAIRNATWPKEAQGKEFTQTDSDHCKELQYYSYLGTFIAQFQLVHKLLKENPDKELVFHVTGVGLGVFGCDPKVFSQAFKKIAFRFQESLTDEQKKKVHVQFESYKGSQDQVTVDLGFSSVEERLE